MAGSKTTLNGNEGKALGNGSDFKRKARIANIAINLGEKSPWGEPIGDTARRLAVILGAPEAPSDAKFVDWFIEWVRRNRPKLLTTAEQRRADAKRLPPGGLRRISAAEIEAGRTAKGGFNAKQLRAWGVQWPPSAGWRKAILRDGVPANCPRPAGFEERALSTRPTAPRAVESVVELIAPHVPDEVRAVLASAIEVFTDGACEPNPGPGGWGFVAYRSGAEFHTASGGEATTTNNRMELSAIIEALIWLAPDQPAIIWTDSEYSQKGCTVWRHGWKAKGWSRGVQKPLANADLWQTLDALLNARAVEVRWTRGHVGTLGNERADELAEIGRQEALAENSPLRRIEDQLRERR